LTFEQCWPLFRNGFRRAVHRRTASMC
jgi:hypothetical protein